MIDINMKVQPSFYDEEVPLCFFYFNKATKKSVKLRYTHAKINEKGYNQDNIDTDIQEKIAYIKEFSIVDEYQATSMKENSTFLDVIGIKKCVRHNHLENEIAF